MITQSRRPSFKSGKLHTAPITQNDMCLHESAARKPGKTQGSENPAYNSAIGILLWISSSTTKEFQSREGRRNDLIILERNPKTNRNSSYFHDNKLLCQI